MENWSDSKRMMTSSSSVASAATIHGHAMNAGLAATGSRVATSPSSGDDLEKRREKIKKYVKDIAGKDVDIDADVSDDLLALIDGFIDECADVGTQRSLKKASKKNSNSYFLDSTRKQKALPDLTVSDIWQTAESNYGVHLPGFHSIATASSISLIDNKLLKTSTSSSGMQRSSNQYNGSIGSGRLHQARMQAIEESLKPSQSTNSTTQTTSSSTVPQPIMSRLESDGSRMGSSNMN